MNIVSRFCLLLLLVSCNRLEPPEFRSDHLDLNKVAKEHQDLTLLERERCIPDAQLPGNRPVSSASTPDASEIIVVDGVFQSEGIYSFSTDKITTIRFFVTYSIPEPKDGFSKTTLSFFADDDCLSDEDGTPVPRSRWPFVSGGMTFYMIRNASATNGVDFTIVSHVKKQ